jgi:hypothetical protein
MHEKRDGVNATLFPVQELLSTYDYDEANYVLWTDNWYTSLEMCKLCIGRKVHCGGTTKVNRKGLPREGIFPKKGPGKMVKGSVRCMKMPGQDIYFTAWQDNKPVHMLSTFRPNLQKIMRKSANLGWKRAEIDSHSLIPAYNHGMGGTDRMDQLNSYYSFQHKGIKWTHRIFSHFLGVSVVNASILYNHSNPQAKLSSIEFFDEIIKSLADLQKTYNWDTWHVDGDEIPVQQLVEGVAPSVPGVPNAHAPASEDSSKSKGKLHHRNRRANLEIAVERIEGIHIPTLLSSNNRRRCVFHPNTKQRYFCETCDVALCLSECGKESCWYKFHHMEEWKDI